MTATVNDTGSPGGLPKVDDPRAAAYLAAVADALVGMPDAERRELLDDLADHLAELVDEPDDGTSFQDRLGSPSDYAADLLAAAGIDVPGRTWPPAAEWRRARERLTGWGASPAALAVRAFLPELRPSWWVLRAWGALALVAVLGDGSAFPVPDAFGNPLLNMAALAALVVGSVRVARTDGSRRWPGRALTAIGGVGVLLGVLQGGTHTEYISYGCDPYGCGRPDALIAPDGMVITNIWPFDAEGRLLEGVLLFDQDGQPLSVGANGDEAAGSILIPGLFPQPQRELIGHDATGQPQWRSVPAPTVVVPRLPATESTESTDETTTTTPVP